MTVAEWLEEHPNEKFCLYTYSDIFKSNIIYKGNKKEALKKIIVNIDYFKHKRPEKSFYRLYI